MKPLVGAVGLGVVRRDLMPSLLVKKSQTEEVNWLPLLEVICCGIPNLATQPPTKAAAQASADVDLSGMASTHLVDLSNTVSKCVSPPLERGRGPTRSMCRWLKRWVGLGIAWGAAAGCLVTLARAGTAGSRGTKPPPGKPDKARRNG
jgi:hypothetical protein